MTLRGTIALLVLLCSATAHAHGRSVSYSDWLIDDAGARIRLRLPLLDLTALEATGLEGALLVADAGSRAPALEEHLKGRLQLFGAGELCRPSEGTFFVLGAADGFVTFEWRVACAAAGPRVLCSDLLFTAIPSHVHFARIRISDTDVDVDRVLDEGHREAEVPEPLNVEQGAFFSSMTRYVAVGFEHILSGADHLLFLLVLVLTVLSLRDLAIVITGFTVAHSVTLAVAAVGYATPDTGAVNAVIGLSIVIVAVENVWLFEGRPGAGLPIVVVALLALCAVLAPLVGGMGSLVLLGIAIFSACHFALLSGALRPERWRWAVATLFGLVHGFGFAGVLSEANLPATRLAGALFGFNVGVELGQLMVVAAVWPAFRLIRSRGEVAQGALMRWGSAAAVCAGTFWFVSRGFS